MFVEPEALFKARPSPADRHPATFVTYAPTFFHARKEEKKISSRQPRFTPAALPSARSLAGETTTQKKGATFFPASCRVQPAGACPIFAPNALAFQETRPGRRGRQVMNEMNADASFRQEFSFRALTATCVAAGTLQGHGPPAPLPPLFTCSERPQGIGRPSDGVVFRCPSYRGGTSPPRPPLQGRPRPGRERSIFSSGK